MLHLLTFLVTASSAETINGDGYSAKLVPKGSFIMGCSAQEEDECFETEMPPHDVTITNDFYVMRSEVTQGLYQKIMGNNPSVAKECGNNCPVDNVTWYDAVTFANKLSKKEGLEQCYKINGDTVKWPKGTDCTGWRLLTEAEWEYAARGGEDFEYSGGDSIDDVGWHYHGSSDNHFNCYQNSMAFDLCDMSGTSCPVCTLQPNGYDLCDMSGNVWEWVWDRYSSYDSSPVSDPTGVENGSIRVYRGGARSTGAQCLRPSYRLWYFPGITSQNHGFRLSKTKK